MSFKKDLRLLLKPYYWVNILLSVSYIIAKKFPFVCTYILPTSECELDSVSLFLHLPRYCISLPSNLSSFIFFQREAEILYFLMIVVMLRTRKAGSVTMINYLSSSFIYAKVANLILWFYADVRLGVLYATIYICECQPH